MTLSRWRITDEPRPVTAVTVDQSPEPGASAEWTKEAVISVTFLDSFKFEVVRGSYPAR